MYLFPVIAKLCFSLQCHMIFQKSFWYADVMLKKYFLLLLLLMLEMVELLNEMWKCYVSYDAGMFPIL